ncbi:hypothetical protein QYE76_048433 [Lolium multiflorum]|uniref:Uncharacterized protein n=1 Tax=Lolium multiflorum TaxID=4521 RepID=A0AAD8SMF5_LOLMU|nr:hypothetical protein QYE76_048433 [Lolium multiflorum]
MAADRVLVVFILFVASSSSVEVAKIAAKGEPLAAARRRSSLSSSSSSSCSSSSGRGEVAGEGVVVALLLRCPNGEEAEVALPVRRGLVVLGPDGEVVVWLLPAAMARRMFAAWTSAGLYSASAHGMRRTGWKDPMEREEEEDMVVGGLWSARLNFLAEPIGFSCWRYLYVHHFGAATKLLDDMTINYSEWHTERAPQGKKVNSVEETSSLSNKIDVIMSMLVNGRSNVDPNNVPLASLVAQEENVDVNFIKNNNFNNNAYRNNSGNNYRPYPSANGNGYGNSYGNSYNNNRSVPPGLEAMLKEFISTQTAFNKSVEEKLDKIDILASKVDRLASDVDLLKLKVMPNRDIDNKIVTIANAIQVRINENIRLMAELHARWEREENEKLAKENNVAKVWTITTTSNDNDSHVATPPTINGKIIGVGNVSTPSAKRAKLPEIAKTAETACDKTAEFFSNIGDNDPIAVYHNGLDFDDCHISEVIKFLQKLARSPNASAINLAFTKHITNALIKAREEKLKLETSIPRKLEDGCEPIIKMRVNDFDCNALCDLAASISVMPKKIYNMLDLPPLKNCYLDVNLADNAIKKPLGRIDNVRIMVNNNLVPVDFVVLDVECNASCPIILGRPFLRTVGATIDMKEGSTLAGIHDVAPHYTSPTTFNVLLGSSWEDKELLVYHRRSVQEREEAAARRREREEAAAARLNQEEDIREANKDFWQDYDGEGQEEDVDTGDEEEGLDTAAETGDEGEGQGTAAETGDEEEAWDDAPETGEDTSDRTEGDSGGKPEEAKKKRKARRPRRDRKPQVLTNVTDAFTLVSESGQPLEPSEVAKGYIMQLGCIVRETVSINNHEIRSEDNAALAETLIQKLHQQYTFSEPFNKSWTL